MIPELLSNGTGSICYPDITPMHSLPIGQHWKTNRRNIEGTEFEVDEAADIVFNNAILQRPEDAYDVMGMGG